EHEHEYDTAWAEDETYHWHECFAAGDCNAKQKDKSMHVDADNDGHCDVCGHFKDSIPEKPVRIDYSVTDTKIIVENAYYGAEEITSHYTEYRLDDGEWHRSNSGYVFHDLAPASTHTLSARVSKQGSFSAGEILSVSVTLNKTYNFNEPAEDEITYETDGRTAVFTLTNGIELYLEELGEWSSEKVITHTFGNVGRQKVFIRYKETATVAPSSQTSIEIRITDFGKGNGTEESPYLIGNSKQFSALQNFEDYGCYFALTDDIVLDGEVWENSGSSGVTIDGRGHKITGLRQETPLFHSVNVAKNLTVENSEYIFKIGESSVINAAILAYELNNAENVNVSGSVTVSAPDGGILPDGCRLSAGGICVRLLQKGRGEKYGLTHCRADIALSMPEARDGSGEYMNLYLGGLAAYVLPADPQAHNERADILRCSADLNLTQAHISDADIGGLVGGYGRANTRSTFGPTANIDNCYTTGSMNIDFYGSSGTLCAGGIAPEITGSVLTCYSTVDFNVRTHGESAKEVYIGGICANAHNETGFDDQHIMRCLFAGSIKVIQSVTEAKGYYKLGAVCADFTAFSDSDSLYYKSGVTDVAEGYVQVDDTYSSSVTEEEMKTVEWQKTYLKISGEYYWNLEDGELPKLK
nr:hypothetical protein [Clostridia bacterium]